MTGMQRFVLSVFACAVCFVAFPLSIGEGGALELAERKPANRAAAWGMDAQVRLFGAAADPDVDPLLVYVAANSPGVYRWFALMSLFAPGVLFFVGSSMAESVLRVFFGRLMDWRMGGSLPAWPLKRTDPAPALVIGELHHKTRLCEVRRPRWLRMPEKGLYTGLAIFGAIGTGKTTSCMRPFCRQLLEWQCDDPEKRAAALVLEVKGDFCYDVQEMLAEYGRTDDYMEVSLGEDAVQWNPLNAPWLDTYSLAFTLASLTSQLFGKSKEPFWQQAYTNVIRWILLLYRDLPGGWVTFRDVYTCMLDREALERLVDRHTDDVYGAYEYEIHIETALLDAHRERLTSVTVTEEDVRASLELAGKPAPGGGVHGALSQRSLGPKVDGKPAAGTHTFEWINLGQRSVTYVGHAAYTVLTWELRREGADLPFGAACLKMPDPDRLELNRTIDEWYRKDWLGLDEKLRSSIVEGIAVFLGIFVEPKIARIFCPKDPGRMTAEEKERLLPPLSEVIESGKVLALNMPAGSNPSLARAVGVMLKQSWLGTLLLRPAAMKEDKVEAAKKKRPPKFFRPAVFVCDEYQVFATCGGSDQAGDEKAFALTRQSRCIPIVATQSISSLKETLGDGDVWRALLQTLRSRIFLSLADDFSLDTASKLLGEVNRMQASFSLSENTGKASASLFSGRIGGGSASAGLSKSYAQKRERLFHPRDINLLSTCQAIAQIFDGNEMRDATRVYLKPDYRDRDEPYWDWYREQQRDAAA